MKKQIAGVRHSGTPLHTSRQIGQTFTALLIAWFVFSLPAFAQTKPNVSGIWKMNPAKSKFNNGGPDAITIVLNQQEQNLTEQMTIATPNGEQKADMKYTLDGKESANTLGPNPIKSVVNWEGNTLLVNWTMGDGYFNRKINLSEDGKVLTMLVSQKQQGSEVTDTVVFDKQ